MLYAFIHIYNCVFKCVKYLKETHYNMRSILNQCLVQNLLLTNVHAVVIQLL